MKKKVIIIPVIISILVAIFIIKFNDFNYLLNRAGIKPFGNDNRKFYTAEKFNIEIMKSDTDYNGNGVDDYTDILNGARLDAEAKPEYKSAYYAGGYPPENEGVCTDTVWRALAHAGYSLKELVDQDIAENLAVYTTIKKPDPNIDFRRARNLKIFFDNNYVKLTLDPYKIEEWMPGDIVIFGTSHIAIVSDRRNKDGVAWIIHNAAQYNREEDALIRWNDSRGISGHYRFQKIEKTTH